MRLFIALMALLSLCCTAAKAGETNWPSLLLVVGASGTDEYGSNFVQQVQRWDAVCRRAQAGVVCIGLAPTNALTDREQLEQALAVASTNGPAPLWLVFIGHGTYDGKEARFNLRGPDVSGSELAGWVQSVKRPLVFINCSSASAPFMKALAGTNRVVITATRSGSEMNFARFGDYFAGALADVDSDLDKDGQVSLLEAFLVGSRQVAEFYQTEGRLMTEHALIDDNGDGLGTPADWFRGIRAIKQAREGATLDGGRANQYCLVLSAEELALPPDIRARRDALELEVDRLREQKGAISEEKYYHQLENLLLQMARLYNHQTGGTNASRTVHQ